MHDEPDPALTGAAFELANAGYAAMPEAEKKREAETINSDTASLREAAEQRSGWRDDTNIRKYLDDNGRPVAANEAITLNRAGRDYASAIAAEKFVQENEASERLAARVDALRAEAMARDPEAVEFYGLEPPEVGAGKDEPDQSESQKLETGPADAGDRGTDGLDPEIEKAIQHPQVRQAIEEKIGEAEKSRQDYLDGLAAATQIAQMTFVSQFPELASIAPGNLPGALELMSQQDPQKFARVQAIVATSEQLFAQQAQEGRRQAEMTRHNFQTYAKSEDARFETMLTSESKAIQHAVTSEIFASAEASGVEPADLVRLFNSEPVMRNAAFQRMMYDAGKYRLMMKAKDAAAAKALPPVQRPGTARTPAEREHADLRTLNARLSSSGDIRDAVALYNARKAGRR